MLWVRETSPLNFGEGCGSMWPCNFIWTDIDIAVPSDAPDLFALRFCFICYSQFHQCRLCCFTICQPNISRSAVLFRVPSQLSFLPHPTILVWLSTNQLNRIPASFAAIAAQNMILWWERISLDITAVSVVPSLFVILRTVPLLSLR